jgi:hypothetical protein
MELFKGFSHHRALLAAAVISVGALVSAHAAVTTLVTFDPVKNAAAGTKIKHVIHYEFSKGGHDQANTRNHLTRLANKYGFRLDRWTAKADVTPENLTGVDIAVFNQGDGDVLEPATSSQTAAMKDFVQVQGKALLLIHAAAAYIECPSSGAENLTDVNCRWLARVLVRQYFHHDNDLVKARIYADSVKVGEIPPNATGTGAVPAAINHGKANIATKNIFIDLPPNGGTGATAALTTTWDGMGDEWYNYRGYVRQQGAQTFDGHVFGPVNVLLSLDETGYTSSWKIGDRSVSWTRTVGNGITAYNNIGHSNAWTRSRSGNALGGTVTDSVAEKYNWRLMKYLARDFVGCTSVLYTEFNEQATVEALVPADTASLPFNASLGRRSPCQTRITALAPEFLKGKIEGLKVSAKSILIPTTEQGAYNISVTDVAGKSVYSQRVSGGVNHSVTVNGLNTGVYLVRVTAPKATQALARVAIQ